MIYNHYSFIKLINKLNCKIFILTLVDLDLFSREINLVWLDFVKSLTIGLTGD